MAIGGFSVVNAYACLNNAMVISGESLSLITVDNSLFMVRLRHAVRHADGQSMKVVNICKLFVMQKRGVQHDM